MNHILKYCITYFQVPIHGLANKTYVSLLYVLLPDRCFNTYMELLNILKLETKMVVDFD